MKLFHVHNIYPLSLSSSGKFLVYAPLVDAAFYATKSDLHQLASALTNFEDADEELKDIISNLTTFTPISERKEYIRSQNDFINLSILPNNKCNFSCSYCYSANGRDTREIDWEQVKTMIDFFLSPQRNNSPYLTVSIFGGGEPLLSWEKITKPTILYLYQQANQSNRKITTTLITNGSLIPQDFIDICRTYNIDLVCSYEILEEIQNIQRKHFDLVTNNIQRLIDNSVIPAINAVITEKNVARQTEMIHTLHERFPDIRYVAFEPVIDTNGPNTTMFYDMFMNHFLEAYSLAQSVGITLTCSVLRNVDVTVDRYCPGELALCADGSLSICPCVSSPNEPNYNHYIYGEVENGRVIINDEKLQTLLSYRVNQQPWCKHCFAKYNCGGGCINKTLNNNMQQDHAYCHFVQKFLKQILINRLNESIYE